MKSSVVAPYPSAGAQDQQPRYESRKPHANSNIPHPPPQKPQRQLEIAPVEGWFAMVLLAVAVYSVVFSIIAAHWVNNTYILIWSTAVGLLVGFVIAKIHRFPQTVLHLAACLIGHWLSIWLASVIAFHVSWGVLLAAIGAALTDPTGINNSEMVFLFYLSFLCFFLGYFGAWLIYRAHLPWLVALVYCSILFVNLSYVKQDLSFLVIILLAALILLIARVQLATQLAQWKSEGLHTDRSWLRGITWRFMQIASLIGLLTLLVSLPLPALGQPPAGMTFWGRLDTALTNVSQGHFSWQDPGSLLQPYQAPANFFGDQLSITGSVHLPTGEVLYYTSTKAPQYLEGFSFDHFDGHTWTSLVSNTMQNYSANALLPNETLVKYTPATTSVTVVVPPENAKHYIFAPAQPVDFDVATTLYGKGMMSAWAQQSPLSKGEQYQVISNVSTASPHALAAVPFFKDNPDLWTNDTNYAALQTFYLQRPAGLSSNVKKTIQQWTQGSADPYDALKMLEAHLSDQTQFSYAVDNIPVPSNVNSVDWLLQTHRGFCTYYASAMVVMARILGIPTRMMSGFSHGHLDGRRKVWVVQGDDAHSWVQAYFPNYGWINFDPTPGFAAQHAGSQLAQPPVPTRQPAKPVPTVSITQKGTPPARHPLSPAGNDAYTPDAAAGMSVLVDLTTGALLFSFLLFLVALALRWWRNLYPNSTFIAGTFWRLCRVASWVGLSPRSWQTPYEYSSALGQRIPAEAATVWRLTELFVRERWAPPRDHVHKFAGDDLEQLRPGLRRIILRLMWMRTRKR